MTPLPKISFAPSQAERWPCAAMQTEKVMPYADSPINPFVDAQNKWDDLQRDLMLARDEVAQQKEEIGRLNAAIEQADDLLNQARRSHDEAMNAIMASAAAERADRDEQIATLTRERDVFKTLSIQQTTRLRDLGEQALRIVQDSKAAAAGDPALAAYAKPLVAGAATIELSTEDEALLKKIAAPSDWRPQLQPGTAA